LLGLRSAARPFSRSTLLQKAIALSAKALGLHFEAEQKRKLRWSADDYLGGLVVNLIRLIAKRKFPHPPPFLPGRPITQKPITIKIKRTVIFALFGLPITYTP
jgi:hypothetical protein